MAQLIVLDYQTTNELGRRAMAEAERYDLYAACGEHELFAFNGRRYRLHSVAWRVPQGECVVRVTFDSYEPTVYSGGT